MSAAAVNAIVSPWFLHGRPAALATAYNGGSVGGVIFSPLWVAAIALLGFPAAAAIVGTAAALTMWVLADLLLSRTPQQMGLAPDGDATGAATACVPRMPSNRCRDRGFGAIGNSSRLLPRWPWGCLRRSV